MRERLVHGLEVDGGPLDRGTAGLGGRGRAQPATRGAEHTLFLLFPGEGGVEERARPVLSPHHVLIEVLEARRDPLQLFAVLLVREAQPAQPALELGEIRR